jgi:hypothetical protein
MGPASGLLYARVPREGSEPGFSSVYAGTLGSPGRWLKRRRPRIAIERIDSELITLLPRELFELSRQAHGVCDTEHDAWLWRLPGAPGSQEDHPVALHKRAEDPSIVLTYSENPAGEGAAKVRCVLVILRRASSNDAPGLESGFR